MNTVTANEAKTHFGETILKAQRAPVEITRNGKPVAVIVSIEDFQATEEMKEQHLREQIRRGLADAVSGHVVDGKTAFDKVLKRVK